MALNRNGVKPDKLSLDEAERDLEAMAFGDILGQDAINRFDRKKKRNKKKGGDRVMNERRDNQSPEELPQDRPNEQPQGERRERRERPQGDRRERHDRTREGSMPRNDMRRAPRPDRIQRNRQPKPNRREGRDGSQNLQNKG